MRGSVPMSMAEQAMSATIDIFSLESLPWMTPEPSLKAMMIISVAVGGSSPSVHGYWQARSRRLCRKDVS